MVTRSMNTHHCNAYRAFFRAKLSQDVAPNTVEFVLWLLCTMLIRFWHIACGQMQLSVGWKLLFARKAREVIFLDRLLPPVLGIRSHIFRSEIEDLDVNEDFGLP
jgi:hypothetical protein